MATSSVCAMKNLSYRFPRINPLGLNGSLTINEIHVVSLGNQVISAIDTLLIASWSSTNNL